MSRRHESEAELLLDAYEVAYMRTSIHTYIHTYTYICMSCRHESEVELLLDAYELEVHIYMFVCMYVRYLVYNYTDTNVHTAETYTCGHNTDAKYIQSRSIHAHIDCITET